MNTKRNTIFEETQPMYGFVAFFILITLGMLASTYFQWGRNPISSWGLAIILSIVTTLPVFLFYNMKIVIDTKTASVRFGIGWLKRSIAIHDLDLTTAQIVKIPWYAGIGYRINNRGTFFNTKPGSAVYIKTKNKLSEFYVGTRHAEEIIRLIEELQST